ncbi:MAG TPA: ACP S-malonyltransferase [Anaerolineales bacterium]|nr:ACP S-malonyltransferase [Anaerolineales bacterium]
MLNPNTTAFVFPGQGSQSVGMGKALADSSPAARQLFAEADDHLQFKLSDLCWNGPEADLNDTHNTQPALYVCSLAALAALHERLGDFKPAFAAGHSLGEITALVAADGLNFVDGLGLVRERGRLMKRAGELSPGGMAAILNLDADMLAEVCAEASAAVGNVVQVANDNCPGQVVISGDTAALEKAMELAKAKGAKRALRLPVSIAAHSPLMQTVVADYDQYVQGLPIIEPLIPVIGNATAGPLSGIEAVRRELVGQLTTRVRWTETIRYLAAQGVTHFVELGSKDVLTGLLKRIAPEAVGYAVGTPEAIEMLGV